MKYALYSNLNMLWERQNKIMQGNKLSYMQMQEWIRTMCLMARARFLSLERDSPYLWFDCHRWVEPLTMKLSFTTLSW